MHPAVNEYLIELYKREGTLTPLAVVEDAKREESPLHALFEWDIEKAAQEHWYEVARQLIRNVKVTITHESSVLVAPYFVRDTTLPARSQGYTSVENVRKDSDAARDTVADECARAASAFRRAAAVAAAVGVDQDVLALLNLTLNLKGRVKDGAAG